MNFQDAIIDQPFESKSRRISLLTLRVFCKLSYSSQFGVDGGHTLTSPVP